jgi:hypothetical protein
VVGTATTGSVLQRDRLAQSDGRPAADRDAAVGAQLAGPIAGQVGHLDRHVHPRLGEHPGRPVTERRSDPPAGLGLLGTAQHQRPAQAEPVDLVGQRPDRPDAEHDPHRQRLTGERQCAHGGKARVRTRIGEAET